MLPENNAFVSKRRDDYINHLGERLRPAQVSMAGGEQLLPRQYRYLALHAPIKPVLTNYLYILERKVDLKTGRQISRIT